MDRLTLRIPRVQAEQIQQLVQTSEFTDQNEAIRAAIRDFLKESDESRFDHGEIIEDMAFLYEDGIPPDVVTRIHKEGLPDLNRLADAETLYFVVGSYSDPQKERVKTVRDLLSEPEKDEAFILEEVDPNVDIWENFYVKFRVLLLRCHYVIGVFEDNDGGHELEIGEVNLSDTYILKRGYDDISIEGDIEYDKYDAMLGTLFNLLDRRGHLHHWTTENELKQKTKRLGSQLGNAPSH